MHFQQRYFHRLNNTFLQISFFYFHILIYLCNLKLQYNKLQTTYIAGDRKLKSMFKNYLKTVFKKNNSQVWKKQCTMLAPSSRIFLKKQSMTHCCQPSIVLVVLYPTQAEPNCYCFNENPVGGVPKWTKLKSLDI